MSFSSMHLFFDDVEVGQEWESFGRTMTETDIVAFAGLSGDYNSIHIDHEFAKNTPFRRPIAHGLLTLAMASGFSLWTPPMRTIAFLKIRELQFLAPVFIGDTLRLKSRLAEKNVRSRGRRAEMVWHRQMINQEQRAVQDGYFHTLVEGRALHQRGGSDAGAEE